MTVSPSQTFETDPHHFQALFDHSQQGTLVISSQGLVTYANEAAERILGTPLDKSPHFLDFSPTNKDSYPGFYPKSTEGIERDLATKVLTFPQATGTIEMRLVPLNRQKYPSYLVILQDVTLRKKVGVKLANTHAILDTLTSVESKFILDKDLSGLGEAFASILSRALSVTGSDQGLLAKIEKKGDDIHFPLTKATSSALSKILKNRNISSPLGKALQKTIETGSLVNTSLQGSSPYSKPEYLISIPLIFKGDLIGLSALIQSERPFDDDDSEFLMPLIQIAIIMIEGYRQEQEKVEALTLLKKARDEALAARGAMSSFLTNMSHEIRTPLNIVMGMTEVLLNTDLTPHQEDLAEKVYGSAELLLALINDILDLSKIEAGQFSIHHEPIKIRDFSQTLIDLFQVRAQKKDLTLKLSLDPSTPEQVTSDRTRLRQILTNLLANSIKFTSSGSVTLRISHKSNHLKLEVEDTGPGIAPESLPHIFDKFYQEESAERKGSGLGLAISQQLVSLLGGTLQVESKIGKGSKFWFELPL